MRRVGHEIVEADLPGSTSNAGPAKGTLFNAAMAWIVRYWIGRVSQRTFDYFHAVVRLPKRCPIEARLPLFLESAPRTAAGEKDQS